MADHENNPEYDLENLKEQGLAQQVKNVDTGEQYYRLHPGTIEKHRHLIQHDDQIALTVFGLYFKTAKRETDKSTPTIVESAAVLFRDRCGRNLLRLLKNCSLDAWRAYIDKVDEKLIEEYDP